MIPRKWNDNWLYWKRGDSFALSLDVPESAVEVSLPHDAMIAEPPHAGSPNGGNTGYYDGGVYAYEKRLMVPADGQDTWFLKLEGVYQNAMVYVNNELAAHRPYGYTTFYVPLHDYLRYGQENAIRVEVRNSAMTNSRWYSGSGIYRDVYLLTGNGVYFAPDGIQAETLSVSEGRALVELRAKVLSRIPRPKTVTVSLDVRDPTNAIVASLHVPLPLPSGTDQLLRQTIDIPDALLWSENTPCLYRLKASVLEGETVLDESEETFGVRTMTLDAKRGLRINGEPVKLRGACIHHDNGLLGAAAPEEAEWRRVRLLKEAGFNAIRMSHNPMSPAMLRACDALGVYVMDETFDMWTRAKCDTDYALWFGKWWEEDVEAMVAKDYNHPSVILYCLGNEIPEVGTPSGVSLLRRMAEKIRSLDRTRYTTIAINGVFALGEHEKEVMGSVMDSLPPEEKPSGELNVNAIMTLLDTHMDDIVRHPLMSGMLEAPAAAVDLVGYNYMTGRYTLDRDRDPFRVIVGSETYPPEIGRNWTVMEECPNVVGDFTWTGWDYIGEAGIGVPGYKPGEGGFGAEFPCRLGYCGDLDITGFRRPASYYREIVFGLRKEPYIAVQDPRRYGEKLIKTNWILSDSVSSWTWPGMEGKSAVVEVYCAAPEVELLVNGSSLGRKPAGPTHNFTAYFETIYTPGCLTAVAWDGDTALGQMELPTAGTPFLRVTEENWDGELHFYKIEMVDEHGTIHPAADCEIVIRVENGELLGFGTGDPKPLHGYGERTTRTWQGRAQAIVRSSGTPSITVKLR